LELLALDTIECLPSWQALEASHKVVLELKAELAFGLTKWKFPLIGWSTRSVSEADKEA
jgi:hypothetical protein